MFTTEEIAIANKTCRSSGASVINPDGSMRAVVVRYVEQHMDKNKSILDFGAGKGALHSRYLRYRGFENVTSYDFGSNVTPWIHDTDALNKQFNTVFASNVINTCSSAPMLTETLYQMWNCVEPSGHLILNYPTSPRKIPFGVATINGYMQAIFHTSVQRVAGTSSAPVWRINKPITTQNN